MKPYIAALAWVAAAFAQVKPTPLEPAPIARLCVTAGKIDTRDPRTGHVDIGGMRGIVPGANGQVAEMAFTYRGPSQTTAPLANGELRRQIGLKLRAKDTCNVVYVMWHVEPHPGVAVSVKVNPGAATHAACGAGGYDNVKTHLTTKAPALKVGENHVLRAEIKNKVLRVTADEIVVFDDTLPDDAFAFDGPSGVRSDNGEFDFELHTPSLPSTPSACPRP